MKEPAILLIPVLFCDNSPISQPPLEDDNPPKKSKGRAIPKPNTRKLKRFSKKPEVVVDRAKRTTRDAGLHGKTMAPKKNPNTKEPA